MDIALGTATGADMRDYSSVSHNREELLLYAPDFHPLAAPEPTTAVSIDILRFQDTPFVMRGNHTPATSTQALFQEKGFSPTVVYQSNNMQLIDTMTAAGAVAKTPWWMSWFSGCRPSSMRATPYYSR